jgi:RNA polymerase sigma-70 factor, ECF subfamily
MVVMGRDENSANPNLNRTPVYSELVSLSDEALLASLRDGHSDALAVLFDRYCRLVMSIALRILRDAGEAEDLVQSIFLEIFRSAAHFDPAKGTAKVWILHYAYHRGFNRRQYLNLRGLYEPPQKLAPDESVAGAHAASLDVMESARTVRQALGKLDKAQRRTLELAFYEGLTMHEIAERTHESFHSVRHHYYRGLEKLRSILRDASDDSLNSTSAIKGMHHVQS